MPRMRWLVASFVSCAVLAFGTSAYARGSAQLRYTREVTDESCPDDAALRRMVAAQLGYDPFEDAATMRVDASILRKANRLHGRVTVWRDGALAGERALDAAKDCDALATALAVTISVAIDPMGASRPAPAPAPPAPVPPPPTPASPPASPTSPPAAPASAASADTGRAVEPSTDSSDPGPPAPATRPSFRVTLAPLLSVGIAPAVAPGISASVGGRWSFFSIAAEGRLDLPASAPLSIGGEVSTSVALATLVPCIHVSRWVGCALGSFGSMRAESKGITSPAVDDSTFAAVGLRGGFEIPLSRAVALRPQIDVLAALTRPALRLNGRTIWTTPPVSGAFGAALVVQLGGSDPL